MTEIDPIFFMVPVMMSANKHLSIEKSPDKSQTSMKITLQEIIDYASVLTDNDDY